MGDDDAWLEGAAGFQKGPFILRSHFVFKEPEYIGQVRPGGEIQRHFTIALTLARTFNAREGFGVMDDLPHQRFYEPMTGGTLKGQAMNPDDFLSTREMAYNVLGWDPQTAAPLPWKLVELGVDWAVDCAAERENG